MAHTLPDDLPALEELKAKGRRWVVWKEVQLTGRPKPTKVPYSSSGTQASTTNPKSWSTYEACAARLAAGGYDGLGFVLTLAETKGEPEIIAIDLDDCVHPKTGEIEPWACEIIDRLKTYTEISPSATGLHLFARGVLPMGAKGGRKGSIECYASERYLTVTGFHLEDYPDEICEAQEAIEWLWLHMLEKTGARARGGDEGRPAIDLAGGVFDTPFPFRKIAEFEDQDSDFKRVFAHRFPKLKDQSLSGYDMSLAVRMAHRHWSEGEIIAVIREFRQRHGSTEKAAREDYLLLTARTALQWAQEGGSKDIHKEDALEILRMRMSLKEAQEGQEAQGAQGAQDEDDQLGSRRASQPEQPAAPGPHEEQPPGRPPDQPGQPDQPDQSPPVMSGGGAGQPPDDHSHVNGASGEDDSREEARAILLARLGVPISALIQIGTGERPEYHLEFTGIAETLRLGSNRALWSHDIVRQTIAACTLFPKPKIIPLFKTPVWHQMVGQLFVLREMREPDSISDIAEMREMFRGYLAESVPVDLDQVSQDKSLTRDEITFQMRPFFRDGKLWVVTEDVVKKVNALYGIIGKGWREINNYLSSCQFKWRREYYNIPSSRKRSSRCYWGGQLDDLIGPDPVGSGDKDATAPPF